MFYANFNVTSRSNELSETDLLIKVKILEAITGIGNLLPAFTDTEYYSDYDAILNYVLRIYTIIPYNEPFEYVTRVFGFNNYYLKLFGADREDFYDGMTCTEAIETILAYMLDEGTIESHNGFPVLEDVNNILTNCNQITNNNNIWLQSVIPFNTNDVVLDETLENIIGNYEVPEGYMLLYHGTSWDFANKINIKVETTKRQGECSDFGSWNFYLTDNFKTAKKWSYRKKQSAVVVFVVPLDYITNLNKHLKLWLDNFEEWKDTVFRLRYPPSSSDYRSTIEYNKYVKKIDSNDLISSMILANPKNARTPESLRYLEQDKKISDVPYQYSFKNSIVDDLDSMKLTTIYFQRF